MKNKKVRFVLEKSVKINKELPVFAIGFLFLIEFPFFRIGVMEKISHGVQSLIVIAWGIKYAHVILRNVRKPFFGVLCIYELWICLIEIYEGVLTFGLLYSAIAPIVVLNVIYVERKRIVDVLYIVYAPIVSIQIIVLLFFQKSMQYDQSGILGGRNGVARILILGFMVCGIKAIETKKRIPTCLCLLIIAECFLSHSATAMIMSILALALVIFTKKAINPRLLATGIAFVEYYLVAIFPLHNGVIGQFTAMLGKRSTFTSRTDIWLSAGSIFKNNILFGAGRGNLDFPINYFGTIKHYSEAHNLFLQILLQGGIPALLFYCIICYITIIRLEKCSKTVGKIMMIGLVMIFVNGLMESIGDSTAVLMCYGLVIAYATMSSVDSSNNSMQQKRIVLNG